MSICSFEMTVVTVEGDEVDVTVHIESSFYSAETFDSPGESSIDFWIEGENGEEVSVSQKVYSQIESEAWEALAEYAESARADYEIDRHESRRYESCY